MKSPFFVAKAFAFLFVAQAFPSHWVIEAESPATRVLLRNDTLDITSPAGLSLWWDEPLQGNVIISYRACVVVDGGPTDRLSDLNCFWMATDPAAEPAQSPLRGAAKRGGRFVESYRLRCYYVGFGGNYNTTTRFRRYDADTTAVADAARRPQILTEYTDSAHLLQPNRWYDIRLECIDGRVRYYVDDTLFVDFIDPESLKRGWFSLRTTWSHLRLTAFRLSNNYSR